MVKLSDVELPIVFKNQLLFKSGNWNRISFSNDMVKKSVDNTKWSALNKRLYLKHDGAFDVSKWKGNVENIQPIVTATSVEVRGDVQIWDAEEGVSILYGKKPVAISADIEYNDEGTMFFTGFAIENDPGVRDSQMFLSDAVKNELNGMYHAKFSNELDATNAMPTSTTPEPIDNQSAERRLIIENSKTNMTDNPKTESAQVSPTQDLAKQLLEKIDTMEASMKQEIAKVQQKEVPQEQPKEEPKPEVKPVQEPVKTEGTISDKPLSTIVPQGEIDDKLVNSIADKLVEKIKPSLIQPMTINEFGAEKVDPEQETVNRLVQNLAKI